MDPARYPIPKTFGFALRTMTASEPSYFYVSQSEEAAHRDWFKAIFSTRSYILRQERPDLFAMTKSMERAEQKVASLRRALTGRRNAELQRARSARKQVQSPPAPAPLILSDSLDVHFEKGSLLDNIGRSK